MRAPCCVRIGPISGMKATTRNDQIPMPVRHRKDRTVTFQASALRYPFAIYGAGVEFIR